MSYEGPYFEKYLVMDSSPMGAALTQVRIDLVRRHFDGHVLDIGIGGGRFVTDICGSGFDVNAHAVDWLQSRGLYQDPYEKHTAAITCWDSLEHIPEPEKLINQVTDFVFVSVPIFDDPALATRSKHYRPGEHIWYWSRKGLVLWFEELGFVLVEENKRETDLGREGIYSFAFRRRT